MWTILICLGIELIKQNEQSSLVSSIKMSYQSIEQVKCTLYYITMYLNKLWVSQGRTNENHSIVQVCKAVCCWCLNYTKTSLKQRKLCYYFNLALYSRCKVRCTIFTCLVLQEIKNLSSQSHRHLQWEYHKTINHPCVFYTCTSPRSSSLRSLTSMLPSISSCFSRSNIKRRPFMSPKRYRDPLASIFP